MHNISNNRKVCHIYPAYEGGPEPRSDITEEDIWDELSEATLDLNERRTVTVMPDMIRCDEQDILEKLKQRAVDFGRVAIMGPKRMTRTVSRPAGTLRVTRGDGLDVSQTFGADAVEEVVKVPLNLRSESDLKAIAEKVKGPHNVLAIMYPPEDFGEPLVDLSQLQARCPTLTIYIFHHETEGKCRVEWEGCSDYLDPEVEFPALCDTPKKEVEPIVEDMLLKDCIHVGAGAFESFKTTAAIELCAAILGNRDAFEYFKVLQRHPILFCCPDMGASLFDDYAAPFGLREFGKDFRVQRDDTEVFHGIDSPVLQAAVRGHILFLDTMLDYARIQKAFESSEWIEFFAKLRLLISGEHQQITPGLFP